MLDAALYYKEEGLDLLGAVFAIITLRAEGIPEIETAKTSIDEQLGSCLLRNSNTGNELR